MRKLLLLVVFSLAGLPVAAQQQASQPTKPAPAAKDKQGKQDTQGKQESDYEWRMRTEGAAGGTKPVPEREREGVGAGAKPHMHFDQLDRGLHRRSDAEVIVPPK
jgi:hypothetical protein